MLIYEEAKYTSLYSHKRGTEGAKIHGILSGHLYIMIWLGCIITAILEYQELYR